MLETKFNQLIQQILEIQISHLENDEEKTVVSTDWEFIFSEFDGWVILNISTDSIGGFWIYPVLYPEPKVSILMDQLPSFSVHPPSVAYSHVMSGSDQHWIEPYWEKGSQLNQSEIPLFFHRLYYGHPKGKERYVEFNQLVTHPLELHWSEKKNSYCSVNDLGDEVEKIKIINANGIELILIRRRTLDKLLYLGQWVLVRYFIFDRWLSEHPDFEKSTSETYELKDYQAKFELRKCGKPKLDFFEYRGAQIERPATPKENLLSWKSVDEEEQEEKQYASFTVYDWKNKRRLTNYSLCPSNFSNYFTQSDLPYEISPIFFKAEVLDKYKNDPDKFELTESTITCRGGWHLNTYDVNEYHQVHTYAVYLARLPYKEQLHWCQYNEEPKGQISQRAFEADFQAKWSENESKIQKLKAALENLSQIKIVDIGSIWSPKGGSWELAARGLHPLVTENSNQWHDFIIALANTTNEGFQKQPLKVIAARYGNQNEALGTLGLIKFILNACGKGELVPPIHGVLNDLQEKRGKGKAHGTWATPEGSLISDAEKRFDDIINAVERLSDVWEDLKLPQ